MSDLPELPAMSRRDLLLNAILLVGGAAVTLPTDLWAQQDTARFFDAAPFALLDEVAEIIIPQTDTPGARGVGVPQAFDALMRNWASPEHQKQFGAVLADIDRASTAQAGKPLLGLAPEKRIDIVAAYDSEHYAADKAYAGFKRLVLTLYYLSEPGATQELRYEHVPGVWQPSVKMTPETRAWASPSAGPGA